TVHEGRKDFACDKCEKKFAQKSDLMKHQRTVHEGRKDYACDQCEKKFGDRDEVLKTRLCKRSSDTMINASLARQFDFINAALTSTYIHPPESPQKCVRALLKNSHVTAGRRDGENQFLYGSICGRITLLLLTQPRISPFVVKNARRALERQLCQLAESIQIYLTASAPARHFSTRENAYTEISLSITIPLAARYREGCSTWIYGEKSFRVTCWPHDNDARLGEHELQQQKQKIKYAKKKKEKTEHFIISRSFSGQRNKFCAFIYTLCARTVRVPYTGATVFLPLCERDFFKKKSYVRETPKHIGTCQVEGFVDLSSQSQSYRCNLTEQERRNPYSLQPHKHSSRRRRLHRRCGPCSHIKRNSVHLRDPREKTRAGTRASSQKLSCGDRVDMYTQYTLYIHYIYVIHVARIYIFVCGAVIKKKRVCRNVAATTQAIHDDDDDEEEDRSESLRKWSYIHCSSYSSSSSRSSYIAYSCLCQAASTRKKKFYSSTVTSASPVYCMSRRVIHVAMTLDIVDFRHGRDTILPHDPRVKHHELGSRLPALENAVLRARCSSGRWWQNERRHREGSSTKAGQNKRLIRRKTHFSYSSRKIKQKDEAAAAASARTRRMRSSVAAQHLIEHEICHNDTDGQAGEELIRTSSFDSENLDFSLISPGHTHYLDRCIKRLDASNESIVLYMHESVQAFFRHFYPSGGSSSCRSNISFLSNRIARKYVYLILLLLRCSVHRSMFRLISSSSSLRVKDPQIAAGGGVHKLEDITADDSKFNYVVGALDQTTAVELMDVIDPPPADEIKYKTLKDAILNRTTDSTEKQLHQLLTSLSLGSDKPSALWRRMKSLASDKLKEDALKVKWLDLLPQSASMFLSILKTASMDELTEAADKLVETGGSVMAVSRTSQQEPADSHMIAQQRLAALEAQMAQVVAQLSYSNRRNSQQRGRSSGRRRDGSQHRGRSRSPDTPKICWYHRKHGKDAERCTLPCPSPVKIQNLPVKHSIVTSGPPVAERPRRLTGERLAAAKEAFDDLLKKGIIRPSNSQWASPLHLVPKAIQPGV
ncbi:unnamed protein product, partial [Trichogramma brassicae]